MLRFREYLQDCTLLKKVVRYIRRFSKPSNNYSEIVKILEKQDKQNAINRKELAPLHEKLNKLRWAQSAEWGSFVYCDGYFYQGYSRIGINGIKPTEERLKKYEIDKYFTLDKTVIDIGANSGFLACYLSEFVKEVDAIELNPYLIEMGKETAFFLERTNINFIQDNFIQYKFKKTYDLVFSLSNHFTIDGNLNIDFESYMKIIYNILNNDGVLFFESHNIDGDDKDIDKKFAITSKYFKLVDYKMVSAFYPADIDKLFAIFRRRDNICQPQKLDFKLENAREKYQY